MGTPGRQVTHTRIPAAFYQTGTITVWVKIDDMFPTNPKVQTLSDGAFRLYISGLCWCNAHLTDGRIPDMNLRFIAPVRTPAKFAAELVEAGLWERSPDLSWQIHDYLKYQRSAEAVRSQRDGNAQRQAAYRDRNAVTNGVTNDTPSHPSRKHLSVVAEGDAEEELGAAASVAIRERTGQNVPIQHALSVARQILSVGKGEVRNPVQYVVAAIAREPDMRRLVPYPQPPPVAEAIRNALNPERKP